MKKLTLLISTLLLLINTAQADTPKKMINIQHWTTSKGARVLYVNAPHLPMVDIKIAFAAGAARDGNKLGLAAMTNQMMEQGAGPLNADQIATRFEEVGAKFGSTAARDMAVFSLRSLTDPALFDQALTTFSLVLSKPSFPENALKREKRNQLTEIKADQQSPSSIATKAFYQTVFKDHPYAHPVIGTEESIPTFTRDNLIAFSHQYYVAKNAVIAIVGDIDRQGATKIAEQITQHMPVGQKAEALPKERALNSAIIKNIEYPSSQTNIRIGQTGITRKDPDYFPLIVGNYTLGGASLVSRLTEVVREKHGLTYSIYSHFQQ